MANFFTTSRDLKLFAHRALVFYCLTAAISIALSQVFLISMIAVWLLSLFRARGERKDGILAFSGTRELAIPLSYWVAASCISAAMGVNFFHALLETLKSSLYVLVPFAVVGLFFEDSITTAIRRTRLYFLCLIGGHVLAGLHTVLSLSAGYELAPRLPGPVTESGQLVLVLPFVLGLLFCKEKDAGDRASFSSGALALVIAASFFTVAWPEQFQLVRRGAPHLMIAAFLAGAVAVIGFRTIKFIFENRPLAERFDVSGWVPPPALLIQWLTILLSTLVVNLKRGPWVGVICEFLFLGLFFSRRLFAGVLACVTILVFVLQPVRARLEKYQEDFSIEGGRKFMWELGAELSLRYPLGLGPDNAAFMRTLEPSIPPEHRHMHNNLLNVAVESGWIGFCAYVWWMVIAVFLALSSWRIGLHSMSPVVRDAGTLSLVIGTSLAGWQAAGFVEYNFGDGEIRMVAFFAMGLVLLLAGVLRRGEVVARVEEKSAEPQVALVPSPTF